MRARRLRVGVNLLWIVPGDVGGSEEYTVRLMLGAVAQPDDVDLVLFMTKSFARAYPELATAPGSRVCPIEGRSRSMRIAAETTWLAVEARRRHLDLVHHAGGTIPVVHPTPSVVTIHDLQPLFNPQQFTGLKRTYLRWRLPPSVQRPRLVITLTQFIADSVVDLLGVDPHRIVRVPPGYTPSIAQTPEGDPAARYDLDGPFFLYPAITYPFKNHVMLVRAFAEVVVTHPEALLVLTSRAGQAEDAIRTEAERLGVWSRVRRVGRVPRGDIDWLFQHAAALTFPSRFEGFGMPCLEAMGLGCPVLAADAAALPEVVGDGGMLVDPNDPEEWTKAMALMLDDPSHRAALVAAGQRRLDDYQWAPSVAALLDAYRRAASA